MSIEMRKREIGVDHGRSAAVNIHAVARIMLYSKLSRCTE